MAYPAIRRATAVLALATLPGFPLAAFDTFWHSQCSRKVGQTFGFTEQAWKIMQLGNFSPDFFGPVSEYAAKSPAFPIPGLDQSQADSPQIRGAALFLHFDNLSRELQSNSDIDYIFSHLLQQAQTLIAGYNRLAVDSRVRKTLTLVTLGAALHAVQDFYSHSDWTHNDFDATRVKTVRSDGILRAPTWFEFRGRYGDPAGWPIQTRSGIYPPIVGERYTHTHMNHDNSRLVYPESENPGPSLRPQAEYHSAGPVPALGDEGSDLAHQQFAVDSAAAASVEFVAKVEENPEAKNAIESAKTWRLSGKDARLAKELDAGYYTAMAISCAAGKWDGNEPPGSRGAVCWSVLAQRVDSVSGSGSKFESELLGLASSLLMPRALRFTGMFWDVHGQYHILEQLAEGFGSSSGHYQLPKK